MRPDGRRRARGNLLWLVRPEPNKLRIASVGEGGRPMKQEWKRMGDQSDRKDGRMGILWWCNHMVLRRSRHTQFWLCAGCMMSVRCTRGI